MRHIQYAEPRDIAADPPKVGGQALDQLATILRAAEDITPGTAVQVRSSYQSLVLEAEPDIEPSELALRWTESPEAAAMARLAGAIEVAIRLCETARSGL